AMNASYQVDGRSGKSIFDFDIVEPGSYRVVARYGDGRTGPTIILAIGHDFAGGLLILVFSALGIMFLGLGGGAAIAIITYLTRERALSAQKGSK
ncbi:MAG: hypothetical protein IIB67_03640, partial [Proteobacteria bacterium]|nr:hypothetical protein [Pseudomonadota bacterium]